MAFFSCKEHAKFCKSFVSIDFISFSMSTKDCFIFPDTFENFRCVSLNGELFFATNY